LAKYEPTEKILKAESISNGQTKRKTAANAVYISGGLLNYVIALINESSSEITPDEVQMF
jgi:hypothetical protein